MLFITSNEGKFEEFEEILDVELERKDIELDEIQAVEIEKVIEDKLNKAYKKFNKPLIVDDTGIFVGAWNRLPGALSRFFMEKLGNEKICEMLGEERRATVETYVGYKDKENTEIFRGVAEGRIAEEPKGEGFGWDPIFIPKEHKKTFGEMSKEEKNEISMRKKALEKLKEYLYGNPKFQQI